MDKPLRVLIVVDHIKLMISHHIPLNIPPSYHFSMVNGYESKPWYLRYPKLAREWMFVPQQ